MIAPRSTTFADAVFWIALVARSDQYHARAVAWAAKASGRLVTTDAVLPKPRTPSPARRSALRRQC